MRQRESRTTQCNMLRRLEQRTGAVENRVLAALLDFARLVHLGRPIAGEQRCRAKRHTHSFKPHHTCSIRQGGPFATRRRAGSGEDVKAAIWTAQRQRCPSRPRMLHDPTMESCGRSLISDRTPKGAERRSGVARASTQRPAFRPPALQCEAKGLLVPRRAPICVPATSFCCRTQVVQVSRATTIHYTLPLL